MKKVMLLGAGNGQMPFLKICKEKGYYVIVVSIDGDYPCFKEADKTYHIDTRNKEEILKAAQQERIDAIITDQTDVSVPAVAYVAEKMGLRGIGYETALKFTDKYEMRKAAKQAGVGVPDFDKATTLDEALKISHRMGFPLIIKPTDSSGSRGVTKINSEEELRTNFDLSKKYSSAGTVIVEQFIEGKEYLVDGFAMGHKYINLDLGEKEYFNVPNIFVSKMCMFSSAAKETDRVGKMVLEANKKLVTHIGLKFGITHAEYLYSEKEDKVYLVEVAARGGGVYLSSHITPAATGFDTNRALIEYAVEGKETDIETLVLDKNVSAWVCFSFPDGVISNISGVEETEKTDGVYLLDMHGLYKDKNVSHLCDDSGKHGPVLIFGESKEECYGIIEKVKKTLKIDILTENGIKPMIW